jgi:membrane protease YdiL (CAAX protease family)
MSNKVLLLGLLTLIGFPVLGYLWLYGLHFQYVGEFFQWDERFNPIAIGFGLMFGFVYAFIALLFMQAPVFDGLNSRMEHLIGELKLSLFAGIFLSICAGLGEELLFRAALQPTLGIWMSSILFVAIHGYLNPWNWRFSLYGLIILPFVVILSYGFDHFGLWFAVMAHFAYDVVLFTAMVRENEDTAPRV